MDFKEYQAKAHATAIYPECSVEENKAKYLYPLLGLVGETGEVAEKIKKIIRNKNGKWSPEDIADIRKELGDILWYLSELSSALDIDLDQVAIMNIKKLQDRMTRGVIKSEGDNR